MIWQRWTPSGDPLVIPRGATMVETGYVQQRLTPQGVQLLRSTMLSTGLFEHDLLVVWRHHEHMSEQLRRGDRFVSVNTAPSNQPSFAKATPAQVRGLAQIEALLADLPASLPSTAWADRDVRSFVPSHYVAVLDRFAPDTSKLPSPLRDLLLLQYKRLFHHGCQVVTTGQERSILRAFAEAGIAPSSNHAYAIDFDFAGLGFARPSDLYFAIELPGPGC